MENPQTQEALLSAKIEMNILNACDEKKYFWPEQKFKLSDSDIDYLITFYREKIIELGVDSNLDYEQAVENKIKESLVKAAIEKGSELTNLEIDYLTQFWSQHIEKSGLSVNLCYDDFYQTYYPIIDDNQEIENAAKEYTTYIENFDEILEDPQFQSWAQTIIETIQQGKNIKIFSTHTTVASLPIEGALLDAYYKKFYHDEGNAIPRHTTIYWGPSLATRHSERYHVSRRANCRKFHPSTGRGIVPGLEIEQSKVSKQSYKETIIQSQISNKLGEISIIAISGTQDKKVGEKFILQNPELAISVMQKFLLLPNTVATIVGDNSAEIYGGRERKKGNVYIHPGSFIEFKGDRTAAKELAIKLQERIANLVRDEEGNIIGEWAPNKKSS